MNGALVRRTRVASLSLLPLVAAGLFAACDAVDTRQPGLLPASAGGGGASAGGTAAGGPALVAGSSGAGGNAPDEEPPVAGLEPGQTCADAGPCLPPGELTGCVPRGPRDCSSERDNDCDGVPDDTLDDVCRCVPGRSEVCDPHPGFDGRGSCQAGSRACILGDGNSSSDWGACAGAVGPLAEDDCSVAADDSSCDGVPNGNCDCTDGDTAPCGPNTDDGVCERGISTCDGGAFGPCVGAVFPADRDCASELDNDCDGLPDDTLDGLCECVPGDNRACASDARSSRCNSQGRCAACLDDADCRLVSGGRSSCADGQCFARVDDGSPCREDIECTSGVCRQQFPNLDGDQFPDMTEPSVGFCGNVAQSGLAFARFDEQTDCCDTDDRVFPEAPPPVPPADIVPLGDVRGYAEPNACGDFDYDCDNNETSVGRQVRIRPTCTDAPIAGLPPEEQQAVCRAQSGWSDDIPACGVVASFEGCSMVGEICIRAAVPVEPRVCF